MTPALWSAIATALRAEIADGARAPGDRLPTEAELATRFGVNRHTLRRAIASLVDEGLVRTRRGAGTYVAAAPPAYPMGRRVRFRQSMEAAGRVPGKSILSVETRPSDTAEATALRLEPGALIHITEGLAMADGEPVAHFRSRYPAERLPGIADALRDLGSVTAALAACGVSDYTRLTTRLTAEAAAAHHAALLHLPPGAALLRSEAINVDPDGIPVEYGVTRFAGTRIVLTLDH
ncbi:MAG: phosphonate metabolism transcriptional regulator PhnF [Jannaschia sp.]